MLYRSVKGLHAEFIRQTFSNVVNKHGIVWLGVVRTYPVLPVYSF